MTKKVKAVAKDTQTGFTVDVTIDNVPDNEELIMVLATLMEDSPELTVRSIGFEDDED